MQGVRRIKPYITLLAVLPSLCACMLSPACLLVSAADGIPSKVAGAGALLDPRSTSKDVPAMPVRDASSADASSDASAELKYPDLFMADIDEVMNVRKEPSSSSEKIGVLYKDCGGTILEQQDGWTKIKSGDLVGWASNDYLVFGAEAERMARDVGVNMVEVTTESLRVRGAPDKDAIVHGLVTVGDRFPLISEDDGSGYVCIDFDGKEGYISSEYADISFQVDSGETLAAIQKREEEARKAKLKAKLTANQGAVQTNADETRLLAALIQCEAGNQPYEGQLGVGAVVMNRVRSGAYPNSVVGVIYASGQFTPAGSGRVAETYNGTIKDSCLQAAQAAINGETTVGGAVHFRRAGSHEGTVIGGHVFW